MNKLTFIYQAVWRRLIAAAICITLLLTGSAVVFAADPDPAAKVKIVRTTDLESGDITQEIQVSGIFPADYAGKKITLTITNPKAGETAEDLDKYLGIRQTVIKVDGSFHFLDLFNAPAGDYRAAIMADTMGKPILYDFYVSSIDDIVALFDQLKGGTIDKNTLLIRLDNNSKELGLDGTIYKTLNQLGRISVCESLIKDFKDFTVDAFSTFFDKAVITNGLDTAQSADTVKSILTYYDKDYLQLDKEALYGDFTSLSKKDFVYSGMLNETYQTIPDVGTAFNRNVVFAGFRSIVSSSQVGGLIEKYKSYLGFDTTDSTYIKYKTKIENYLAKNMAQFTSLDQIIEKLNDIIANPTKYFPENPSGGNNGGGGGTSGKPSGSIELSPDIGQTEVPDDLEPSKTGFVDVPDDFWGKEAILYLSNKGIISGRDKEHFCPDETITRAEFTKIMLGALRFDLTGAECEFEDVSKDSWFYPYVAAGFENGIIKGTEENRFYPDEAITRQDAALLLKRSLEQKGITLDQNNLASFLDESAISDYAKESVLLLAGNQMIKGFADNTFKPFENLTRAEAAQLIYNAITVK